MISISFRLTRIKISKLLVLIKLLNDLLSNAISNKQIALGPSQKKTGSLFGNSNTNTQRSGGLFGNTQTNTNTTDGLFGNTQKNSGTTGGGLFGNKLTQQTGDLFVNSNKSNTQVYIGG